MAAPATHGPGPPADRVRAFVLSLAPLLVTNVVSIVWPFRAQPAARGQDQGRGLATVALVVDLLVLAAWALVLSSWAEPRPEEK